MFLCEIFHPDTVSDSIIMILPYIILLLPTRHYGLAKFRILKSFNKKSVNPQNIGTSGHVEFRHDATLERVRANDKKSYTEFQKLVLEIREIS